MTVSFNAYLDAYARVETELRSLSGSDRGEGLAAVIRRLARNNRIINRYLDDLLTFHELRNVIVHERRDNSPIADPLPSTVQSLEKIADLLTNPPRVDQHFLKSVCFCAHSDTVSSVARIMLEGNFSQVPVVDESGTQALLTAETIARWYASTLDVDYVADGEVEEALGYTEDARHLQSLARDSSVLDALAVFDRSMDEGYSVDAILITQSGSLDERLLGVITPFDIPHIHAVL